MPPVATITIPLSDDDVAWLRSARDTLAPEMTDAQVLGWMASQGRHLLAQDITDRLIRHHMAESAALEQAIRAAAIPTSPTEFGGTE